MSQKAVPLNVPAHWSFAILPGAQLLGLIFFSPERDLSTLCSFFLISLFASWRLFSDGRPYSLNKLWWVFCLLFFGIIPSIDYIGPERLVAGARPFDTNLVVMICLTLFEGVRLWASSNFVPQAEGSPPSVPGVLLRQYAHFAPAIVLGCGAALLVFSGLLATTRSIDSDYSTWLLLAVPLLRVSILWCSVVAIILFRQHRLGKPLLLLLVIPTIFFILPVSLPASFCLTVLLAWLLASGFLVARRKHLFSWLLVVYFLLIAPAFENVRMHLLPMDKGPQEISWANRSMVAYDWRSLSLSMKHYVSQDPASGRQLMGAVLFFVPRSVWPNKPDGSEKILQQAYSNEPVSGCTLFGEGFLNFGIWGACFFSALLALVIAGYDGWYWRRGGHLRFTLPRLFYFVSFGLLFFLLHGDLQYAFFHGALFLLGFTFWQSLFFWRIIGPKYQLRY